MMVRTLIAAGGLVAGAIHGAAQCWALPTAPGPTATDYNAGWGFGRTLARFRLALSHKDVEALAKGADIPLPPLPVPRLVDEALSALQRQLKKVAPELKARDKGSGVIVSGEMIARLGWPPVVVMIHDIRPQ